MCEIRCEFIKCYRVLRCVFNTNLNCVTFECLGNRLQYALLVSSFVKMSYCMLYTNIFWFPNVFVNVHANSIDRQMHDDNVDMKMVFRQCVCVCDPVITMVEKKLFHRFHICMEGCAFECASNQERRKWKFMVKLSCNNFCSITKDFLEIELMAWTYFIIIFLKMCAMIFYEFKFFKKKKVS